MPELPEVETVRRELEAEILNQTIETVALHTPLMVRGASSHFQQTLQGNSFSAIHRRGKLLQFELSAGTEVMLAHLKMTGQFLLRDHGEISAGIYPLLYAAVPGGKKTAGHFREQQQEKAKDDKHCHITLTFETGKTLSFRDQRKFGYLQLVSPEELLEVNQRFGIDPLLEGFTVEAFQNAFKGRSKSLKAILMDQQLIAGIGNIYADEICHRVGIRPQRSVKRLSKQKKKELYEATKTIIDQAVAHKGTTFRDFQRSDGSTGGNAFNLQVYGRAGESCLNCSEGSIQKITHLGRGTHFCAKCQC